MMMGQLFQQSRLLTIMIDFFEKTKKTQINIFMKKSMIFLTILLTSFEVFAQQIIQGPAVVLDGDTIKINHQTVRLFGIDAPEKKQNCKANNQEIACGQLSKEYLEKLVANKIVTCEIKNQDMYKRSIGICSIENNIEVNNQMVKSGNAVAYRQYSKQYINVEEQAKQNHQGIWNTQFEMPWIWRKNHKSQ